MLPDKPVDLLETHLFDPLQFPGVFSEGFVGIVFVKRTPQPLREGLGTQRFTAQQEGFGSFELFGGDALLNKLGDHFTDYLDRFVLTLKLGLNMSGEVAG